MICLSKFNAILQLELTFAINLNNQWYLWWSLFLKYLIYIYFLKFETDSFFLLLMTSAVMVQLYSFTSWSCSKYLYLTFVYNDFHFSLPGRSAAGNGHTVMAHWSCMITYRKLILQSNYKIWKCQWLVTQYRLFLMVIFIRRDLL